MIECIMVSQIHTRTHKRKHVLLNKPELISPQQSFWSLSSPTATPVESAVVEEEGDEEEEEIAGSGTGEDEPLLAPRVKVAEDGSLIIDEERSVWLTELLELLSVVSDTAVLFVPAFWG